VEAHFGLLFRHAGHHRTEGRFEVVCVPEERGRQLEAAGVAAECQEFGAVWPGVGADDTLRDADGVSPALGGRHGYVVIRTQYSPNASFPPSTVNGDDFV
jgi:hypothetical protein